MDFNPVDLYTRVQLAREGGDVERCHVHPHLMRYSVGHHTYGVVVLLALCWKATYGEWPRPELLMAALFHDTDERIFGDLPQPVKLLLGERLKAGEQNVLSFLGLLDRNHLGLSDEEQWWLDSCDRGELYMWSIEEAARGNRYFLAWCDDYDSFFAESPPPKAVAYVLEQAKIGHGQRLSFRRLKVIAGLE